MLLINKKYTKGPFGPFIFIYFCSLYTTLYTNNNVLIDAYYNLACALQQAGNIQESLANYQKALQIDPTHLSTLLGIAKLYKQIKNYDKAIEYLQIRLKIDNQCYYTHYNLAHIWKHKKNIEKARTHYKKAIMINPHYMPAYQNIIPLLQEDEAIQTCNKALSIKKNNTKIRKQLIEYLIKKKKLNKALYHCNILLEIEPSNKQFHIKKAQILSLQNKFDQAISIFETLSKDQPHNTSILYNIAHLHKKSGQYEKAIHLFKAIEEKNNDNQKVILSLAQSYLALGYDKQGWQYMYQYNSRKQANIQLKDIKNCTNKIILIQGELYANQTIQLIRYAKLIKDHGAKKIIVQAPDQLIPLLQQSPYIDETISIHKKNTPAFHKLIPLSSLPYLCDTIQNDINNTKPYLFAPPKKLSFWKKKLHTDTQHKIGIYITNPSEIPIEKIMNIANIKNTSIYILHNIPNRYYIKHITYTSIIHQCGNGFFEKADDILQLSALLPNLDLLICCDSFIAHLAGALHVPTCVMLPRVCHWLWPVKGSITPWYPTIHLYRQQENWDTAINELHTFLQSLMNIKN